MYYLRIVLNLLRKISKIAMLLAAVVGGFLIWASWPNHPEEEHSKVITNNFDQQLPNDSVYSLITYNIGYLSGMTNNLPIERTESFFTDNLHAVYTQLETLQASIICLQEIDYHSKRSYFVNQQEALQNVGYNYVYQAANWDVTYLPFPYLPISAHFGEVFSGQSILSKYPITTTQRYFLEPVKNQAFYAVPFYLDRLAQIAQINIDGKEAIIINVHLEAFDKPTRLIQAEEVADLYASYADKYPVFLVGDFNSDMGYENAAIKDILNLTGIKNAADLNLNTYPSDNPNVRLDYILYNEDFIELKSAKVLSDFGEASDHLPVLMAFKLK